MTSNVVPFQSPASHDSFAEAASKPLTEKELKLVTPDGSNRPFLSFVAALEKGELPDMRIVARAPKQRLINYQIDTPEQLLRENGISLRIRGKYTNGRMVTPDINIKTAKASSDIHMTRGEYEARIDEPALLQLQVIKDKYAQPIKNGLVPDLEKALDLIHQNKKDLVEHFLIDTIRTRRVVQLDGFGEKQKFFAELVLDKVNYQLRSPQLGTSFRLAVRQGLYEIEAEPVHEPCEYNIYAGCENNVCSGLDAEAEDIGLLMLKQAVMKHAEITGHPIIAGTQSKSTRGFNAIEALSGIMATRRSGLDLTSSFTSHANRSGHDHSSAPFILTTGAPLNLPFGLKLVA